MNLRTIVLATAIALCAAGPATAQTADIEEARIAVENGMPRLMINGQPVLPIIFFHNTDVPGEWSKRFLREQVKLASGAGVHLYSFPARVDRADGGRTPDHSSTEERMKTILSIDPEARFILRMFPGPWTYWAEWSDIPEDEVARFADGSSRKFISIASDYFWKLSNEDLTKTIQHHESGPFGKRILAYHIGGPENENFLDSYREKGPDQCGANQRRFREWLKQTYPSDTALQEAWGRPDVTLDNASVPTPPPGRFPMHGAKAGETARILYDIPREQDWIDYSRYSHDIVSDRLLDWATLVKAQTDRRKLTVFFYGYTFELCGSFSGHYRLDRLLAHPDVDVLAGPISYMDRMGGGPGGFMSPVDSVAAHGKLWINEDDTRTSLLDPAHMHPAVNLWQGDKAKDLNETLGVLDRSLGAMVVHRAGTWWMDLIGAGAFSAPEQWAMLKERSALYAERYATPRPFTPDVALIIDESSKNLIASDWDANFQMLVRVRNEAMKTGASVGFYLLSDFLDGTVPPCKAYLFANALRLSKEQATATRKRLETEKATAIWVYAPGCVGPKGFDGALAVRLTGIRLRKSDGRQGSVGEGLLADRNWGWDAELTPRPVVDDPDAETLGRYAGDHAPSAALRVSGGARNIVLCDLTVSSDVMRTLFEASGVHIWTRGGEVVQTDGEELMVHSGPGGGVTVHLPSGTRAQVLVGREKSRASDSLELEMAPAQTAWLKLSN